MTESEISENRKTEYEQVCESHRTITDFRAKFLALLPIASSTGLFLVFKDGDKALSTPQVNAIGWLGLAATVGLAIHDYHAIRDCLVLMKRGQELERALGLEV